VDDINDRLGFRVDRVWKGPVGREMWIYQLGVPSVETYVFRPRPDARYIIFARTLSADDRKFLNKIDEPTAFGIQRTCGDGPRFSSEYSRQLDKLGRQKNASQLKERLFVARVEPARPADNVIVGIGK
jgi:hypothetical protein